MSVQAIAAAIGLRGTTATEKLLIIALANYADADGKCWPSNKRLVEDTSLSERTVRDTLRKIAEDGRITRVERVREDGSRASDMITLNLTEFAGGGAVAAGGVGQPSPGGGAVAAPLTSFEPSLEPSDESSLSDRPIRKADVQAFWDITPKTGRERTSQRDIENALRAAVRRGHDPADILAAVAAYYASSHATKDHGDFAKGCHRLINDDRWLAFAAAADDAPSAKSPDDITNPSERQMRSWAQDFRDKIGPWREWQRGPKPGDPGCRISPAILEEFGIVVAAKLCA